jgi:hypothetical protein
MHGGHALPGPLSGRWTGGTSGDSYTDTPVFTQDYINALIDPLFLERNSDAALLTKFIRDNLEKLRTGADAQVTKERFDSFHAALLAGDGAAIRTTIEALREAVNGDAENERTIRRIERLVERKRKVLDSLRRYQIQRGMVVRRSEILRVATALLEACTRHIADAATLRAVASDIQRVIGDGIPTVH